MPHALRSTPSPGKTTRVAILTAALAIALPLELSSQEQPPL